MIFVNDPLPVVIKAVEILYPGTYAEILYDTNLNEYGDDSWAYTIFPDDDSPCQIIISAKVPLENAPELLAHELAHVIVGPDENDPHGEVWEDTFCNINDKYTEIIESYGEL